MEEKHTRCLRESKLLLITVLKVLSRQHKYFSDKNCCLDALEDVEYSRTIFQDLCNLKYVVTVDIPYAIIDNGGLHHMLCVLSIYSRTVVNYNPE